MGSREAVYDVLNHDDPEYIPLGVYTIDCDTVSRILGRETYVRDKIRTQLALWDGRRDEVVASLREDAVELYRKLECIDILLPSKDAPLLPPADNEPPQVTQLDEKTWQTADGTVYRASFETNDMAVVARPKREYAIDDFAVRADGGHTRGGPTQAPGNSAAATIDETIFDAYDNYVSAFAGERFIAGTSGGFTTMPLLGGMEEGLVRYALEPELVRAATAHATANAKARDAAVIRPGVDEVFVEEDFASSAGPLVSPAMFRELVFPAMRERISHIKQFRTKLIFHCCGNTWPLLDMFVEAGVDCYQSLQTGVMDIGELKRRYGDRLAFWGGVAVEHLVSGSMEEVRADVRYAFEHAGDRGGFILGPSHSIAYGTKYDNFMAMLEEHDKLKSRG